MEVVFNVFDIEKLDAILDFLSLVIILVTPNAIETIIEIRIIMAIFSSLFLQILLSLLFEL